MGILIGKRVDDSLKLVQDVFVRLEIAFKKVCFLPRVLLKIVQANDLLSSGNPELIPLIAYDALFKIRLAPHSVLSQPSGSESERHDPLSLGVLLFSQNQRGNGCPVDNEVLRWVAASEFYEGW